MSQRVAPFLAAFALAFPAQAMAQAYQCKQPFIMQVPSVERDGPVRELPVTGYTLALSWSPEFCRTREGQQRHAVQCSGTAGLFGLIVHGLWPESGRSWPQWCPAKRGPRPSELRANICLTPSARLLAHEWAKHGSCMTSNPGTYYKVMRILYGALAMPDLDFLSRREVLTAGDLREAWLTANPGWRGKRIGIELNARGWLEELRLCYGKDFMPRHCPAQQLGAKDDQRLRIWRGL